jgi:hypothetical protein
MAAETGPRLVTVYADDDRIVISSRGADGIGSLLGSMVSGTTGLGPLGRIVALSHIVGGTTPQ